MHIDHDHIGAAHTHEHTHDGVTHTHEHTHEHPHDHEHSHGCAHSCHGCDTPCSPMEELTALMKYMIGHNAAHAKELENLAKQLEEAGQHQAYEQTMAAVSDFEKGNMRLSVVLSSLQQAE